MLETEHQMDHGTSLFDEIEFLFYWFSRLYDRNLHYMTHIVVELFLWYTVSSIRGINCSVTSVFSFQRLMLIIQWSNKVTVTSGSLWIVFETWCAYILRVFAVLAVFNSSSLVWLKLFESNIFLTHVFCEYLWFVVFCFCLLFMYFDEIHELVKHLNLKWYQTIKSIISKLGYF